ncbi:MAG: bifunctional RNase H/acid phosphatase [Corynebacterium sp.]|uniref:bifunctional RNase H/acid phosphatase n=1 Tax=Corynebacterium sp. TaxID=1720 RepID=UPI0026E0A2BB|nr:bifunctional RNase H/acid phosphatase [Corynebacterium sp.]MDO5669141.1 bifunctional RNase H/acid phosphatase [Corynebacterium sp.]
MPASHEHVIVYADGGSRGNPGVAGSGTVVYAADGHTVLRDIVYVVGKKATNNVAEYHGMLRGLEAAAELGARTVEVFMDSKLVVEQMSGRWKIKHPDMQKLALQARRVMGSFDSVTFTWVPRAQNSVADALSNQAMDAAAAGAEPGIVGGDDSAIVAAEGAQTGTPAHWTGATSQPTRFVLLRHGQTAMSAAKQYSGRSNPQLTELGLQQAQAAAQTLAARGGIDAIVSSPLTRCRQTAQTVAEALRLDVEVIDDLIEQDFGAWEGKTFDEAHALDPQLHDEWLADPTITPPQGEGLQKLHNRVRRVRRDLQQRYPGQTILVVSHVWPIKSFMRQSLDAGPQVVSRMFLDLASLSVVEFFDESARVGSSLRLFNDTSHLRSSS